MKGLTHFTIGLAAASCFPAAVKAGADGNPLYFILAGIAGLLPDTIDFKFQRFLYKHDRQVSVDPLSPDPESVATAIADAAHAAWSSGRPVSIKLNTVPLGPGRWLHYEVRIDPAARTLTVSFDSLGLCEAQNQQLPSPARPIDFTVKLCVDVRIEHMARIRVDILDGPVLLWIPAGERVVVPEFLPWHRNWSHSLAAGLLLSLFAGSVFGPMATLVVFLAYSVAFLSDIQ